MTIATTTDYMELDYKAAGVGFYHAVLNGASFEEFAFLCARDFVKEDGRNDAPKGASVPYRREEQEIRGYLAMHEKRLRNAKKMSIKSAFNAAAKEYEKTKAFYQEMIQDVAGCCFKLATVLAKVAAWKPPSEEHAALKEFMIEQLATGIARTGNPAKIISALKEMHQLTGEEYKARQVERSQEFVKSMTKELKESQEGVVHRRTFLRDLRHSL